MKLFASPLKNGKNERRMAMRKIKIQKLSIEAFQKFGTFSPMIDPFAAEAAGPKDADCVK